MNEFSVVLYTSNQWIQCILVCVCKLSTRDMINRWNCDVSGSVLTASAHIITAVIGSGVLSLAWSISRMGWIMGPVVLMLFACVNYFTSLMLADCYRHPNPVTGQRNYNYMADVRSYLGKSFSFNILSPLYHSST